jgi:hypothetical protein
MIKKNNNKSIKLNKKKLQWLTEKQITQFNLTYQTYQTCIFIYKIRIILSTRM